MAEGLVAAKTIRELKDELNDARNELFEMRIERVSLRQEISRLAVDLRVAIEDAKQKQRHIDSLMSELRK